MKTEISVVIVAAFFIFTATTGFSQKNFEPEVFTLTFNEETRSLLEGTGERPGSWPDWIVGVDQRNGSVTENGSWQGKANPGGEETAFHLLVDNEVLQSDLALTLSFSADEECDFAVQIFDANEKVLAVDLFGNVNENSVMAGTDTYIIPLSSYPSACRIVLRQVSGQLALFGMLAFPVLGELPADPEAELTMLNLLGGELSEESRLFRALDDLLPGTGNGGYAGEDGKPLSREEIIRSLRTEVIQELATTNAEFEERLIGTEWLLEDFYRRRYARFLPGGKMLQQHVEGEDHLRMNGEYRLMERSYRVINNNSVLFGIGGFVATFNDNFTEMTYETTSGRKGMARLVGRFAIESGE